MEGRDDAGNTAMALHEAACRHHVSGRADAMNVAIAPLEGVCLRMAVDFWGVKSLWERGGMPVSAKDRIAGTGRGARSIAPARRSFARGGMKWS